MGRSNSLVFTKVLKSGRICQKKFFSLYERRHRQLSNMKFIILSALLIGIAESRPYQQAHAPFLITAHAPWTQAHAPFVQAHAPYTQAHAPYTQAHAPYITAHAPWTQAHAPFTQAHASY